MDSIVPTRLMVGFLTSCIFKSKSEGFGDLVIQGKRVPPRMVELDRVLAQLLLLLGRTPPVFKCVLKLAVGQTEGAALAVIQSRA